MKGFVIVPFLLPLAIFSLIAFISIHFDGDGPADPPKMHQRRK